MRSTTFTAWTLRLLVLAFSDTCVTESTRLVAYLCLLKLEYNLQEGQQKCQNCQLVTQLSSFALYKEGSGGSILFVAIILSCNSEEMVLWKVSLHHVLLLLGHCYFSNLDGFLPEGEQNCNFNASFTLNINVFKIIDSFPSLREMVPLRQYDAYPLP